MTFYSISGCSITVTINFPEPKTNARAPTKAADDNDQGKTKKRKRNKDDPFEQLLAEAQRIDTDFVQKNIEKMNDWTDTIKQRDFKMQKQIHRQYVALSKKEQIEMEERKKNIFLLHRWDIIRERRRQCYDDMQQNISE